MAANEARKTPKDKRPRLLRAFVVLAALSLLVGALSFVASVHYVETNNQKFCSLIHLGVEHPVPKPAHPKQDPSREHAYQGYLSALKLGADLGCY